MVICEWWVGKDVEGNCSGLILKFYLGIRLERLRKTTKDPSQDSRSPGRGLNPESPEYEAGMLNTQPRRSDSICNIAIVHYRPMSKIFTSTWRLPIMPATFEIHISHTSSNIQLMPVQGLLCDCWSVIRALWSNCWHCDAPRALLTSRVLTSLIQLVIDDVESCIFSTFCYQSYGCRLHVCIKQSCSQGRSLNCKW
jgi:hypothetical protein